MIMSRCNQQGQAASVCFRESVAQRQEGRHNLVERSHSAVCPRPQSVPVTITLFKEPLPGCDRVSGIIIGE
jgi:hypothetical protein